MKIGFIHLLRNPTKMVGPPKIDCLLEDDEIIEKKNWNQPKGLT